MVAALCAALTADALFAQQTNPVGAEHEQRQAARDRAGDTSKSDWDRRQEAGEFKEALVVLPALPSGGLIEFSVSTATRFKFFIDPASLSVGADGVVRYVLVARSPAGVDNVSYEGMRCGVPGMVRVYAFAQDGKWSRNANSEWREIEAKSIQRWHSVLRSDYFCPTRYVIQSAAEGVDALRRGGHPAVANAGQGGSGSR